MKKKRILKIALLAVAVAVLGLVGKTLITGYISSLPTLKYSFGSKSASKAVYPDARFAVISDVHFYDSSLGTSGSAFEKCLASDRKLLLDCNDLVSYGINQISGSGVKFVLVTGDLTKDGELVDHKHMADVLSGLVKKGIKVYVIPGNHDINNPGAFRYEGDNSIEVPNVTAAQFAEIYKDCGYGDAVMRDPSSLSYVAEPVDGLWIVGLDTCRYSENKKGGTETIGGRLTQSEETWLEGVLKKARAQGKAVIVMSHHGIIEHWKVRASFIPIML